MGTSSVDVVIPVRDGARTIRDTLASVLRQTRPPRRIIVVDDGSRDATAEIVSAHAGVELIRTSPRGVSHARNTGLRASTAPWVSFLDADDLWRPTKLEREMTLGAQHRAAAFVHGAHEIVAPSGEVLHRPPSAPLGDPFSAIHRGEYFIHGWSARREAILDAGAFDERLAWGEDLDLLLRLAHRHTLHRVPEVLVDTVADPESVTRRRNPPRLRVQKIVHEVAVYEKWYPTLRVPSRVIGVFHRKIAATLLTSAPHLLPYFRDELRRMSPQAGQDVFPGTLRQVASFATVAIRMSGRRLLAIGNTATAAVRHRDMTT